jgi:membrane fusion protein (multidrug efflux system)
MSNLNPSPAMPASRRRPALLALTGLVVLAGAGYGTWWALFQRHAESTDNAYVQAPVVQITPQVGGTVLQVLVDDTDVVRPGQALVKLDPADARLALERAEAQLAQTVREVRTLYANNAALQAAIRMREAEVTRVQAELARAQDDVNRRRPLLASGAVGGEEMKHAESALAAVRGTLASAQSALAAAQEQAASNRALTDGTTVDSTPASSAPPPPCARPSWRCSAPSCRHRWPARWPGARCRWASASRRGRR